MEAGFCKIAIDPPLGIELAGFASRTKPASCIHDDLYVRCLVLEERGTRIAIAVLDLLSVPYSLVKDVRRNLRNDLEIVIAATHTHSGPRLIQSSVYWRYLIEVVTGCIRCAASSISRVERIDVITAMRGDLVYNRRSPFRGATDPELMALLLRGPLNPIIVVSYTAHPVVLGPDNLCISADYPGALLRFLAGAGLDRALFLNGCAGNINPRTKSTRLDDPYARRGATYDEVIDYGKELASSVLAGLDSPIASVLPRLSAAIERVELRTVAAPPLYVIIENLKDAKRRGDRYTVWKMRKALDYAEILQQGFIAAEVAALALGNELGLVFLPSEVFVEHQLYIKRFSPFSYTPVAGYSNNYFGYIPTLSAYEEGGYEVEFPVCIIERGEGERLRGIALHLLNAVHENQ